MVAVSGASQDWELYGEIGFVASDHRQECWQQLMPPQHPGTAQPPPPRTMTVHLRDQNNTRYPL